MHLQFAALRELFKAKQGNYSSEECLSREWPRDKHLPQIEKEDIKIGNQSPKHIMKTEEDSFIQNEVENPPSGRSSLLGLNEAPDEFFDVPERSEFSEYESEWSTESSSELRPTVLT